MISRLEMIRFIHRVRKGKTARQIATEMGLSVYVVRERARRYGLSIARAPRGQCNQGLPFGVKEQDLDELGVDDAAEIGEGAA